MALADQVRANSGLGAKSTGAEVIADHDLAGKVAIVTGGYSSIGPETVRALAAKAVRVIVSVRGRNIPSGAEVRRRPGAGPEQGTTLSR